MREITQDATGGWIVYEETQDGRVATHFDTEPQARWYAQTGQTLTAADAARSLQIMAEETAEQVIAESAAQLLPALRVAFKDLVALQNLWNVEQIGDVITKAAKSGEDIAGLPVAYWVSIGTTFTALMIFLETPIPSIGQTPNEVLVRRNWRALQLPTV